MPDVSIAMSLKDNMSAALIDLQSRTAAFGEDVEQLQYKLDRLSDKKVSLKMDITD